MDIRTANRYAVVGLSCLIPDAPSIGRYWRNILNKKVSIRPLSSNKLKADLFYRPDLVDQNDKQDKTITNIACYFDSFDFKTTQKFKIPPAIAEHMEDNQHAALYVTDQLIQDGGFSLPDTEKIAVVFGNGSTGEVQANIKRRLIQQ